MTKSHDILTGPLTLALLAVVFCVWTALGNDVNICVTTGCSLYQDVSIGGISLWWIGALAFACLAALALLGQANMGRLAAGVFLFGDVFLLLLMAVTAPCVSCLFVALMFALCYTLFRMRRERRQGNDKPRPSILLWVWLALFVIDIGQVAKSQMDVWPMLDESDQPTTRMFFSPTCRYCVEGVNALSGNVNVAFYPVSDRSGDVAKVANMLASLDKGMSLSEALGQSQDVEFQSPWENFRPDMLLLRFRMLCNKAHLFAQGSQGVPFFEFKGLPPALIKAAPRKAPKLESLPESDAGAKSGAKADDLPKGGDASMPTELLGGGQCLGDTPCPPEDAATPRKR